MVDKFFIGLFVVVFQKSLMMRRSVSTTISVLDGTPILLCFASYSGGVWHETIGVTAISTPNFINKTEVGQLLSINLNVVAPLDQRDPVEGESSMVIDLNADIKDCYRYNHTQDKRHSKHVPQTLVTKF